MKSVMRAVLLGGLAMLALSGVAAASASSYTNPILVNSKGEHVSKVKFTGKGPAGAVPITDSGTGQYECSSDEKGSGELSTTGTGSAATTSGTATFLFKGCRELKTGKTGGEFEMKVSLSLVWLGKESEERVGVLAAIAPESKKPGNGEGGKLKYTDHGAENELEGGFVAELEGGLDAISTADALRAKRTETQQEFTKYTEEGKEQESILWNRWQALDKLPFEKAATQFEEEETFPEAVKNVKS